MQTASHQIDSLQQCETHIQIALEIRMQMQNPIERRLSLLKPTSIQTLTVLGGRMHTRTFQAEEEVENEVVLGIEKKNALKK